MDGYDIIRDPNKMRVIESSRRPSLHPPVWCLVIAKNAATYAVYTRDIGKTYRNGYASYKEMIAAHPELASTK